MNAYGSDGQARVLFTELFTAWDVLDYIRNILPFKYWPKQHTARKRTKKTLPDFLINKTKGLKIDQAQFARLLEQHIESLERDEEPSHDVEDVIKAYCRNLEDQLRRTPNTLGKALDALAALIEVGDFDASPVYDAMVLLGERLSPDTITKVVRAWKEEFAWHKQRRRGRPDLQSDIFWVSGDFMETFDGVSRYRFRECFRIGEFEETFKEVERMFAQALLEGSCAPGVISVPFCGDQYLTSVAFDLWLASRSYYLPNRIGDFVSVALSRIAGWQFPEGWWTDFQTGEVCEDGGPSRHRTYRYAPSTYTTALCTLDLLKLSTSEPMREKGAMGVRWLVEQQNSDGSWPREEVIEGKVQSKPDVFTTLLALEALIRSDVEGLDRSVRLGYDWVLSQRTDLGIWEDNGFPFPFMTVLALELTELIRAELRPLLMKQPYFDMAKGFLDRSVRLSLEDNSNSHRLAVIAAYQGIEALLYGFLSQPSVNIRVFEAPDQTIGMRKALTKFQTYLEDKGILARGSVVAYRSSLDRLGYLRDQVVHKGIGVTQTDCRLLVNDAVLFARKYCKEVLHFDMWA